MTIRVLRADAQALVRGAIAALLDLEDDIEVVAEVGRGDEVVEACEQHSVDVAVVDVQMPGLTGIEATELLRRQLPHVRVLIVTTFGRPGFLRRAMRAGADGFFVKDTPARQLADAVRRVAAGEQVVDPALAADSMLVGESPLTGREAEVLSLLVLGRTNKRIAAELGISARTVGTHVSRILDKLGVDNRGEAAATAHRLGLAPDRTVDS